MHPKDADRIANSVDPDQTAPVEQSDLGLHCLPDLSVQKLRIIMVDTISPPSLDSVYCLGLCATMEFRLLCILDTQSSAFDT